MQPPFDVCGLPGELELVLLEHERVADVDVGPADLVEGLVGVRQDPEGGLQAAGVRQQVEQEEEVLA